VVIAAAIGLIEAADLKRIYRIQRWEFWLAIVCFVGVAVLGVIPGIRLTGAAGSTDFEMRADNHFWVPIEGEWRQVPAESVVHNAGNPVGRHRP
jgi:hypothetical protein